MRAADILGTAVGNAFRSRRAREKDRSRRVEIVIGFEHRRVLCQLRHGVEDKLHFFLREQDAEV